MPVKEIEEIDFSMKTGSVTFVISMYLMLRNAPALVKDEDRDARLVRNILVRKAGLRN